MLLSAPFMIIGFVLYIICESMLLNLHCMVQLGACMISRCEFVNERGS